MIRKRPRALRPSVVAISHWFSVSSYLADAIRGRHLSLVVWATTIGAILGPSLAAPAGAAVQRYGVPTIAGPFVLSALLFIVAVLVLLFAAAFVAGWVDAVVGGGGLIQLPALLTALPAETSTGAVLGTNKVASAAGTAVSSWTYVRRIMPVAATVVWLAISLIAPCC